MCHIPNESYSSLCQHCNDQEQLRHQHLLIKRQLNLIQKTSISQPHSKVGRSKDYLAVLEYIPSDKEPDERIYWVLVSIPVLFFLVGVFYLCWNRCGLLKPYCSVCGTICKCCSISSICCNICYALCTKLEKEDLNPYYGADLDEAISVAEVVCVVVFIRCYLQATLT